MTAKLIETVAVVKTPYSGGTVADLIEILKTLDPDLYVWVSVDGQRYTFLEILEIKRVSMFGTGLPMERSVQLDVQFKDDRS